ncbi:MAG: AMP-binding protein [Bdellovibrionaceae bacterium]|nr:AMP-binding protein [Pseudobdellovibrionaceae bacterium]
MTTLAEKKIWHKQYPDYMPTSIPAIKEEDSLLEYIQSAFKKHGAKTAFSFMGSNLSFKEVNKQALHLAKFLQNTAGLKKGDVVALQIPNLPQYPIAVFACFYAGLTITNINPLYTPREMEHQLKDSQAKLIIIFSAFTYKLETLLSQTNLKTIITTDPADSFSYCKKQIINFIFKKIKKLCPSYNIPHTPIYSWQQSLNINKNNPFKTVPTTSKDTAVLQYTGGTTGLSKGAILSHGNILANIRQIQTYVKHDLSEKEVIVTALPLYHIFAFTVNLLTFLEYGYQNILISDPRNTALFIKTLNKYPWSIFTGVNTLFQSMLNHSDFKSLKFKQVKVCIAGGAALQTDTARQWKKQTGVSLAEGYGLTEASPVLCCNLLNHTKEKSIGLPLPSTDIKLMDENDNEVEQGKTGELWAKGPQVMQGYLNNETESQAVFHKTSSETWLKTGDIAYQDEQGFIFIADRKKDMILVSGFNVFPNEIEDVLSAHPKIAEVAVVGVPNSQSGESVRAHIVKKEESLTDDEVIQFAKKNLVNYKVPRTIKYHTELPKSNIGKILRRKLKNIT